MRAYKPTGELYFYEGHESTAHQVAEALMQQRYVVMLSKEEGGTILSYVQTCEAHEANRNYVAFMSYDDFEDIIFNSDTDDEEYLYDCPSM